MFKLLIVWVVVALALLVLDLIWLGVIMKSFYAAELGELARRNEAGLTPRWGAAAVVYVLIPLGIVAFVRPVCGAEIAWWQVCLWGALFGLVVYGVFDLTNLAVLADWSVRMTLVDLAWGCVLCGLLSLIAHAGEQWLTG